MSLFCRKKNHGGISILTKKDETVLRISELEKKMGVFFFFSQLFLMAQNLLLAVQLGGQGSLVSVSFWTEGPGHDRKIHWQMQPEDGGPRVSWTRFYVGVNHRGWMFLEILLTNEDGFSTR